MSNFVQPTVPEPKFIQFTVPEKSEAVFLELIIEFFLIKKKKKKNNFIRISLMSQNVLHK